MTWTLGLGLGLIALMVYAVIRRVDVRLALFLTALALAVLAGLAAADPGWAAFAAYPAAVVRMFLTTLSNEQFVVPICTAMGFAHVLRLTECDQHLVHLLVRPLQRVRALLVPGAVGVGFLVNIPVISQTSTAVAIGTVLVPLLRAAHVSPATTGAALLLGASLGGELLNPGAPELRTVSGELGIPATECVRHILPLVLLQLAVATGLFWTLSLRAERAWQAGQEVSKGGEAGPGEGGTAFRVNPVKALIPALPLALLFLTTPPLNVVTVPDGWLINPSNPGEKGFFNSRLIGAAMLVGAAAAALTDRRRAGDSARAFFDGAGYALTHIVSLIVAAQCFGTAVKQIGLAELLHRGIEAFPDLLIPSAGVLPLAFAWVSGSGMAATQSLFGFFKEPALGQGIDPAQVGAVVSISAAAGRTMSPVAAVTLMSGQLTQADPLTLARRVTLPLLAGTAAVLAAALWLQR